jgi:hypothetical protein
MNVQEMSELRDRYNAGSVEQILEKIAPGSVKTYSTPLSTNLSKAVGASPLSPSEKAKTSKTLSNLISRMPPAAQERAGSRLNSISVHPDGKTVEKAVREDLLQNYKGAEKQLAEVVLLRQAIADAKSGKSTLGCYVKSSDNMHVLASSVSRVTSHELGHAIDGPYLAMSSSKEWREAYSKELAGGQLTKYGATSINEGFAEFAGRVYGQQDRATGGRVTEKSVAEKFPLCAQFFKDNGLWPGKWLAGSKKTKAATASVLPMLAATELVQDSDEWQIPLVDGSHMDVLDTIAEDGQDILE